MVYSLSQAAHEGGTQTMQTAHHSALAAKHAVLDRKIADEAQRPLPDATTIAALKKQKLQIKQELEQIQ
jgi:hypothetical protein